MRFKTDIFFKRATRRIAPTFVFLLLTVYCLLLTPVFVFANAPLTLLDGVTAAGAGTGKTVLATYKDWTCQVNITGSPTAVTVGLDGNLAGTAYTSMGTYNLSATDLSAGQGVFSINGQPANNIRGNLTTFTGGTSPTLTMICVGVQ
jgi:hypothetical protein